MILKNALHFSLEIWGYIFCIISAICIHISKNINIKVNRTLFFLLTTDGLLLFFDSLAWFFRGNLGKTQYYILVVSNFMVFLLGYVLLFVFTRYLKNYIEQKTKVKSIIVPIVYALCAFASILVIISQFTDFYYYFDNHNFYHRNTWFPLSQIWGIIGIILDLILLYKYRKYLSKKYTILFITYMLMPALALFVQIFIYGISLLNIANTIIILLMFLISQMEQANAIVKQERLINEANINITLSQIQPHFLYNSLNIIRYLCKHNTEEAENAINDFSDYLRGNMAALSNKECIPFERELKHLNSYIALEKKRFGKRLTVQYDIQEKEFVLPALCLQPIVENSIKYGLMNKLDGITVKISSYSDKKNYILTVEDNGIGFDYDNVIKDGKPHIGIKNVRDKLQLMCNGQLIIDSKINIGTKVNIVIPKK